jgi:hypothetical protein
MPDEPPIPRRASGGAPAPDEASVPDTAAVAEGGGALAWIEDTPQGPRVIVQGPPGLDEAVVKELVARLDELQQGMA